MGAGGRGIRPFRSGYGKDEMDELLKALTEAVKSGSMAAGPALHAYFWWRLADALISYALPWSAVVTVFAMIAHTTRWCVERHYRNDENDDYRRGEVDALRQELVKLRKENYELATRVAAPVGPQG
jgi:hypothetical protein